jgi:hypothetical protein
MAKKRILLPDCVECIYHYDLHEIGANGKPFMCRCKKHPQRTHFLTRNGCKDFTKHNQTDGKEV